MNMKNQLSNDDVNQAISILGRYNKMNTGQRNTISYNPQDYNDNLKGLSIQKDIKKLVNQLNTEDKARKSVAVIQFKEQERHSIMKEHNYIERFEQHQNQKELWLKEKQDQENVKRQSMLKPVPSLTPKTQKIASKIKQDEPLYQRSTRLHEKKLYQQQYIHDQKKQLEEKTEMLDCTFQPNINRDYPIDYVKVYDPKQQVHTSQVYEKKYSFKPKINKKSQMLAEKKKNNMTYGDIKKTVEKPMEKNDENVNPLKGITFSPYINKNSKKMVKSKFDNLENKQTYLYDNYMKELKDVDSISTSRKNLKSTKQKQEKSLEIKSKNKSHNRTVSNLNLSSFNQVEYQPEYDFLFENLKSIQR